MRKYEKIKIIKLYDNAEKAEEIVYFKTRLPRSPEFLGELAMTRTYVFPYSEKESPER